MKSHRRVLHFNQEIADKEGEILPARIRRSLTQYNFLKLPYYVLCIFGWVPFQNTRDKGWKLFTGLNFIYSLAILIFASVATAIQITAFIKGKNQIDLPFALYFIVAILVFEILSGFTCVYVSRKDGLFINLLEQVRSFKLLKTKKYYGLFMLLTTLCSLMIPVYFTTRDINSLSSLDENVIAKFHKDYYSFIPSIRVYTVIIYAIALARNLFLTISLATSSLIGGVCLYVRQEFVRCNVHLTKMIDSSEIYETTTHFSEFQEKFSRVSDFVLEVNDVFKYLIAIMITENLLIICSIGYIVAAKCAGSDVIYDIILCLYIITLNLAPAVFLSETVSTIVSNFHILLVKHHYQCIKLSVLQ